jgi:predicted aconitase with swiveling domain
VIVVGQVLVAGAAQGPALVLTEPLSFWGGVEATTGEIIDRSHPDWGKNITATILAMPGARGSSSSSSVLLEAVRLGTAPAGIILERPDAILTIAGILAFEMYGRRCPIIVHPIGGLRSGMPLAID